MEGYTPFLWSAHWLRARLRGMPLRMRLAIINGIRCASGAATISVYDRGFLYGDSVFETLRTYGGRPFALDEHMSRLARSAERVLISLPVALTTIAQEVLDGIAHAGNSESYVRVMITRGTGPLGLDPDLADAPNRVVLVEPLTPVPAATYADGIDVILVRTARATDANAAAGAKVANYLTSLLALREAKVRGAAEALIVDARGCVLEGTTSNVFWVRQGKLGTTPEASGILAGITRAHVLELAGRLGIPTATYEILERDLGAVDELFITSSIREVISVVRVDGRTIANGRPGPITLQLHAAFRQAVGIPPEPVFQRP
jgi:branched-chain amino acid aminotransferase